MEEDSENDVEIRNGDTAISRNEMDLGGDYLALTHGEVEGRGMPEAGSDLEIRGGSETKSVDLLGNSTGREIGILDSARRGVVSRRRKWPISGGCGKCANPQS